MVPLASVTLSLVPDLAIQSTFAGCRIEAEVPRRDGRGLRQGQPVALRAVAGQIFPGGASQSALPIQTPKTLKEARS